MDGPDLPEPVRRLIQDCIGSATELEVLLLLHRTAGRSWRPADIDAELRTGEEIARSGLDSLAAVGLATAEGDEYRFAPRSDDRRRAVDALADAFAHRRVRVIEFLYKQPSDRITLFSDAFKLRRPKD